MMPFASLSDEFSAFLHVQTKMDLPNNRETILHFCEAVGKRFPDFLNFEAREKDGFFLEEDRDADNYRSIAVEPRRFSLAAVNPETFEEVDEFTEIVLEMATAHFGLSPYDTEFIEVNYAFDFLYMGNHDEVVAEALAVQSPLEALVQGTGGRVLNFEPNVLFALDESCRLQGRLHIETRTSAYHVRIGQYPEMPLTVNFAVRQFWGRMPFKSFSESYRNQRTLLRDMIEEQIMPLILKPLAARISAKQ